MKYSANIPQICINSGFIGCKYKIFVRGHSPCSASSSLISCRKMNNELVECRKLFIHKETVDMMNENRHNLKRHRIIMFSSVFERFSDFLPPNAIYFMMLKAMGVNPWCCSIEIQHLWSPQVAVRIENFLERNSA